MPFDPASSSSPDGQTEPVPPAGQRQLVLVKHGKRHVFRYQVGEEATFLRGLQGLAGSPESELNWFDAAVLSHQLGQTLRQDLSRHQGRQRQGA